MEIQVEPTLRVDIRKLKRSTKLLNHKPYILGPIPPELVNPARNLNYTPFFRVPFCDYLRQDR